MNFDVDRGKLFNYVVAVSYIVFMGLTLSTLGVMVVQMLIAWNIIIAIFYTILMVLVCLVKSLSLLAEAQRRDLSTDE